MSLTFHEDGHRYYWNGVPVPSVTQILRPLSDLRFIDPAVLESARKFGTAVHRACELHDLGTLNRRALDPALDPYLEGWIKFCSDARCEWTGIEEKIYHPVLKYAGTLDRRGTVRGQQTIVDIKSGAVLGPEIGPQMSAYEYAGDNGRAVKRQRIAVRLTEGGDYEARVYERPDDWSVFCSLLTLRNWCGQHGVTPHFSKEDK